MLQIVRLQMKTGRAPMSHQIPLLVSSLVRIIVVSSFQKLLLNDLFEKRYCNKLLVPEADEDVKWSKDKQSTENVHHRRKVVKSGLLGETTVFILNLYIYLYASIIDHLQGRHLGGLGGRRSPKEKEKKKKKKEKQRKKEKKEKKERREL